jgi:hypothetical protein
MPQTSMPVVVMASGGIPVVNVTTAPPFGSLPATVVTANGIGITVVSANGMPLTLLNPNGTPYP